MSAMMKHIGGQAKKQKDKGPTDAEKSEQRLKEMEAANKK